MCSSKDWSAFISVGTFNRLPGTRAYVSHRVKSTNRQNFLSLFNIPTCLENSHSHSHVSVRVLSNSVSTGDTAESVVTMVQE